MPRLYPPRNPITIRYDGKPVVAQRDEPAVVALVAAGHLALARSPKFHRPRGPSCLRAACDGCLARVDELPNVMTCRTPVADGIRIESQNVVGPGRTDVLRAADWFFPEGMNHHELLASVPGAPRILQSLARRVGGLGTLPKQDVSPAATATRRVVDALVVGAGPSGMATALELAKRGRRVEVIDEDLSWGGSTRAFLASPPSPWQCLSTAFGRAVTRSDVSMRPRTMVVGVYGDDVLVASGGAVEVVTARTLVLAPGAHDGTLPFEGNDVPGVMSARAGAFFLSHGVVAGRRTVIVVTEGGGPFGEEYAHAVPSAVVVRGTPVRVHGGARVREVIIATVGGERQFECDVLLVDAPRSPAYEVCVQAGAELVREARGFLVKAPGGRIRDGVFAVGEAVGTKLQFDAVEHEAMAVSRSALS
ncbi:MAG: FAD-dependent oxidoreductase [Myxococcota bacterium]|nr:FAD-dependent oxidoreductase [Myxococcota bacterium]